MCPVNTTKEMATQTEDGFSYQTLDPRYSEIRLVKLLPIPKSSDEAGYLPTIHCSLRKASLEDDPEYNALSYVWGDPRETRPILIDGKPFRVTVNLEAALRQLAVDLRQQRRSHTWLWVDAICINQTDTSERTHQVCQMSQLYRGAARVIVWLGPPAIDSDTAISTLHRIHDVAESSRTKLWVRSWPMFQFQEAPRPRTSASYIQAALDTVLEMLCADDHRCLDAVASLYERDWFRRVWVVQEVALAREAVLHCGDTKIDWATFYTAFWMLCGLRDYLNAVVSPKSRNLSVATFLNAKLENVSTVAFSWVLVDDETPLRQFLYFLGANANHSRLLAQTSATTASRCSAWRAIPIACAFVRIMRERGKRLGYVLQNLVSSIMAWRCCHIATSQLLLHQTERAEKQRRRGCRIGRPRTCRRR